MNVQINHAILRNALFVFARFLRFLDQVATVLLQKARYYELRATKRLPRKGNLYEPVGFDVLFMHESVLLMLIIDTKKLVRAFEMKEVITKAPPWSTSPEEERASLHVRFNLAESNLSLLLYNGHKNVCKLTKCEKTCIIFGGL